MNRYTAQGFQCEKVIVVTHSMGGLVARALIHPKMGSLKDKVLGIVHGVMPAIGAGAA
jgi:alpha-beta hydrolase superfamily lysophospholipase